MTTSTRHFVRHYVEMLVAMFLGMAVLGTPALLALGAAGVSSAELRADAPALLLLGMGAGLVEDVGTLLMVEHVVMLPSMVVAMLLRREEYSHAAHGHRHVEHAIAA